MIEVKTFESEKGFGIDIKGHADYSDSPSDIVCAAVSALAYTLIGALKNSTDTKNFNYRASSGDFNARFSGGEETRIILNTVLIGLLQIERAYPDNVRVEDGRGTTGTEIFAASSTNY